MTQRDDTAELATTIIVLGVAVALAVAVGIVIVGTAFWVLGKLT